MRQTSCICVTHILTYHYLWDGSFIFVTHILYLWLLHVYNNMRQTSCIYVTRVLAYHYLWHDSFAYVTHILFMTFSRVQRCVKTLLHLWLVGSLRLWVSFAEYCLFYRALLQKRPIIYRSLLSVLTYHHLWHDSFICVTHNLSTTWLLDVYNDLWHNTFMCVTCLLTFRGFVVSFATFKSSSPPSTAGRKSQKSIVYRFSQKSAL